MTSRDIELAVAKHFGWRQNIIIPNVSWGIPGINHECDLLIVSEAGYVREVEIKVSASDIKADLQKRHKHQSRYIRELYYAVPETLATCKYLPQIAGLLSVSDSGKVTTIRRKVTNKDALQLPEREIKHLLHLGVMRMWNLKAKLNKTKKGEGDEGENV